MPKILTLAVALVLWAPSLAQAAWTPAPTNPPNCPNSIEGCSAPVTTGPTTQTKTGTLKLASFLEFLAGGLQKGLIYANATDHSLQFQVQQPGAGFFKFATKPLGSTLPVERLTVHNNGQLVLNPNRPDTLGALTAAPLLNYAPASPGLALDTNGKVGATHYCDENGANCRTITQLASASLWGQTAGTQNIYNLNTGNVGIGTQSPVAKLDVNGTIRIAAGSPAPGKVLVALDTAGNATWGAGGGGGTGTTYRVVAPVPTPNYALPLRGEWDSPTCNAGDAVIGGGISTQSVNATYANTYAEDYPNPNNSWHCFYEVNGSGITSANAVFLNRIPQCFSLCRDN